MQIGTGKKNEETGVIRFDVRIPFLAPAALEVIPNPEHADKRPDFLVLYGGDRAGALWKRTPTNGGPPFLSGNVESPIFPGGRMEVAVFCVTEGDRAGEYDMTWRPAREAGAQSGNGASGGAF